MPGMAPTSRRAARFHGSADEELPRELDFETGDEQRPGRNNEDPRPAGRTLEQMRTRMRAKGSRSGSDDLSPQMLLREDRSRAADTLLRNVPESYIGEGHGLDEAELAEVQPVGRKAVKPKKRAAKEKTTRRPAMRKPSAKKKSASARRRPR